MSYAVSVDLTRRLLARRGEIEQAIAARIEAISKQEGVDLDYREGTAAAIGAAVNFSLKALSGSEETPPPMPTALLSQARLAARSGVSLDAVIRRYIAGYTVLETFFLEEAERLKGEGRGSLTHSLRLQASLLERVLTAVSSEYAREISGTEGTAHRRLAKVKALLAGEPGDYRSLEYPLENWHLGLIVRGSSGRDWARSLASEVDRCVLAVDCPPDTCWIWLGGRGPLDASAISRQLAKVPDGLVVASGEPSEGLTGWRLTHRQAQAAYSVALRQSADLIRYADVAVLASALNDDLLAASLKDLYLEPLNRDKDGGWTAKETLRAYLACGMSVSSAAARLKVSRQTVGSRIRTIEERLDRSVDNCAVEIAVAMQLDSVNS